MLKSLAKSVLSRASALLFSGRRDARRVVLCYHSVHPDKPYASASPAAFAAQVAWAKQHCDVVPFSAILEPRPAGSRPAVAITFDDGYADNHQHALPILLSHGVCATFFLTAGFVAGDPEVLAHFRADRRTTEVEALSWAQARELRERGMEIGAHTWSHANLARIPRARVAEELGRSKRAIEDAIGAEVLTMAYPYGKRGRHFTDETMAMAAEAGYQSSAAVLFRAVKQGEERHAVPRFFINGADSLATLAAKVRGDWDAIGWWQEKSPHWAARLISPADFRSEAVRA